MALYSSPAPLLTRPPCQHTPHALSARQLQHSSPTRQGHESALDARTNRDHDGDRAASRGATAALRQAGSADKTGRRGARASCLGAGSPRYQGPRQPSSGCAGRARRPPDCCSPPAAARSAARENAPQSRAPAHGDEQVNPKPARPGAQSHAQTHEHRTCGERLDALATSMEGVGDTTASSKDGGGLGGRGICAIEQGGH